MSDAPDVSSGDLMRVINRDRYVKDELAGRVAALVKENLELMSIIQEIQGDLADLRQGQQLLDAANGETPGVVPPDQQHPEFIGKE